MMTTYTLHKDGGSRRSSSRSQQTQFHFHECFLLCKYQKFPLHNHKIKTVGAPEHSGHSFLWCLTTIFKFSCGRRFCSDSFSPKRGMAPRFKNFRCKKEKAIPRLIPAFKSLTLSSPFSLLTKPQVQYGNNMGSLILWGV